MNMNIPIGTYVQLVGLSSPANCGLIGVVKEIPKHQEGEVPRVAVSICDSNRTLAVKVPNLILPGTALHTFKRTEAATPPELLRFNPPTELEKAASLLEEAHRKRKTNGLPQLLKSIKDELRKVESSSRLRKQADFIRAEAASLEGDFQGVVNAIGKCFPHTRGGNDEDVAWNDYPSRGYSVLQAIQTLALAIGALGDEPGEQMLLTQAVERFRSSPPPRPPLFPLLFQIARLAHKRAPVDAVPHYRSHSYFS